ncbi:MAG: hypothetical protein WCK03_03420, partial [Candidatus Taylorbacteria bacterium]
MKYYLGYIIGGVPSEPARRRVEQLMQAMKADPAFAAKAMESIVANPQLFHDEALAIAAAMSQNIAAIHGGTESCMPDDEARLLLAALPPDVRKYLWKRLGDATDSSHADLSPASARLMSAMIAAELGDTGPAKLFASDPAFIDTLESRLSESIPSPFLEVAKNDARIGDKLAA